MFDLLLLMFDLLPGSAAGDVPDDLIARQVINGSSTALLSGRSGRRGERADTETRAFRAAGEVRGTLAER